MVFAIGGVIIGVIIYPVMLLVPVKKRNSYGQYVIHICLWLFTCFMRGVGIYSITVNDKDRITGTGMYIVANHPTLLDVVILLSIIKQSDCVVKSALAHSIFTKGPLLLAGYIVNDSPEQLLDTCVERLKAGRNLLIFPEGTRTRNLETLKFQRGAALIAFQAFHDITPITIECKPRMLAKNQKWYKIPRHKPHFTISVGQKILISDITDGSEPKSIGSRKINKVLLNYYKEELELGKTN